MIRKDNLKSQSYCFRIHPSYYWSWRTTTKLHHQIYCIAQSKHYQHQLSVSCSEPEWVSTPLIDDEMLLSYNLELLLQIIIRMNFIHSYIILAQKCLKQQINNLIIAFCFNSRSQMTDQPQKILYFKQLRQKYPEKIVQLSMKAEILMNWIKKYHFPQFQQNYRQVIAETQQKKEKKVLDENLNKQLTEQDKKQIVKQLLQAIKIVVESYEQHEQNKFKYDLDQVQKMVNDAKKTFKQLSQATKKKKQESTKQPKHISVLRSNQSLMKKNNTLNAPQKENPKPENGIFVRKNSGIIDDIKIDQKFFKDHQQKMQKNSDRKSKSSRSKSSKRHDTDLENQEINLEKDGNNNLNFGQNHSQNENGQLQNQIHNQVQVQKNKTQSQHDNIPVNHNFQAESINHVPLELPRIYKNIPQHKYMPFLSNSRPTKLKSKLQTIRTNPFIKKTFHHLCRQSYIGGGTTFEQIAQSSDVMSLNKWMVFCKQFSYVDKFKKKQLVDIYHQVTNFTNKMFLEQFLNAIILLQNKLRVDEQDFLNSMGMDSEFNFRQKVGQFKVRYNGPQINFFQQATKLPVDKHYQKIKLQKFKKDKQKQKQIILHQGKFRQQIIAELSERKQFRSNNKSKIGNQNNQIQTDSKLNDVASPYLKYIQSKNANKNVSNMSNLSNLQNKQNLQSVSKPQRRIQPLTYSDLFQNKSSSGNTTRAFSQSKKPSNDSSRIQNAVIKSSQKSKKLINLQKIAEIAKNSRIRNSQPSLSEPRKNQTQRQYESTKLNISTFGQKPQRQWIIQKDWSQQYKSDSDQSDDILKQHLNNQKKVVNTNNNDKSLISKEKKDELIPNKINLSRMMQEYVKQQEQYENYEKQTQGGDDNMITKVERFK